MKASDIIMWLLKTFVELPIWLYLMYKILLYINASELMWFLFIFYVAVCVINPIIGGVVAVMED